MENRKSDQVVFIKDLLFAALYQWRRIVIAAVVCAVILGGFFGITQMQDVTDDSDNTAHLEAIEEHEQEKAVLEQQRDNLKAQIESQVEYIEKSPVMILDPNSIYRAYFDFTVHTDYQIQPDKTYQDIDPTNTVIHAYCSLLNSEQILSVLAETLGCPVKYVSELLSIQNDAQINRSAKVVITADTQARAQELLGVITDALQAAQPQLAETVGEHTFEVISSGVREELDSGIAGMQAAALDRLVALRASLDYQEQQLSSLKAPAVGTKAVLKTTALFAVIGGLLGAFLAAGIAVLAHIAGDKVYSARTLRCSTGVRVLGCVHAEKKHFIDRWLCKLEGRVADDTHDAAVVANVRNYCADSKHLLVTGCSTADTENIAQKLKAVGIDADFCGDLLNSADALNSLRNYDAILLVETCGVSCYSAVRKTLSCVNDLGIHLIGCVVIGG